MIINKSSWHYKLYKFTYWGRVSPTNKSSLCQYMRRILLILPLLLLLHLLILIMFSIVCPMIFGALCLFIGGYSVFLWPYRGSPTEGPIKSYHGLKLSFIPFEIYPWHVILSLGILTGLGALIYLFTIPMLIIMGILFVGSLSFIMIKSSKSETLSLISNVITSKKDKLCPPVEFQ